MAGISGIKYNRVTTMQVQINRNVKVEFTPQGISYILDTLANCPWKIANPIIMDIMAQLKTQEEVNKSGKTGHSSDSTGGGYPGDSSGGVPAVEAQ